MTTAIEWTDETCNVVAGCTAVDAGCTNCYAASTARLRRQYFDGLARRTDSGRDVWTGKLRYRPDFAERLLRTQKPKRVFWCSMGDLFHEDVPDEWLDHAFAVMALTPHLLHQVLTRRVERMADYLRASDVGDRWQRLADGDFCVRGLISRDRAISIPPPRPLPNVVAMTSVIDQETADERLPHLLACPARWRSVSYEPALGPVDWSCVRDGVGLGEGGGWLNPLLGWSFASDGDGCSVPKADQVIAGGESGPHARPAHPQWFRDTRDACAEAGVEFFFKQWGEWIPAQQARQHGIDLPDEASLAYLDPVPATPVRKIGKKAAGRQLDGRHHDGEPWEWRDGAWRAR